MKWHAVSWSDDISPCLILWRFSPPAEPEKEWEALVVEFLSPSFIFNLELDRGSNRLGFILQTPNDETFICVWNIETKSVFQYNMLVKGLSGISCSKWVQSISSSEMVYAVSAETGYYEHRKDKVIRWEDPLYRLSDMCSDDFNNKFFFGDQGELRMLAVADFYESVKESDAEFKVGAHFPVMKHKVHGNSEWKACLHLHRCANCARPLIFPLISKGADLENCYCSTECQAAHWPTFVATHGGLDFGKL
jgi:hypothetical protein